MIRGGVRVEVPVILEAPDRSVNQGFRIIATVYLLIGLYVLFRRLDGSQIDTYFTFSAFFPSFFTPSITPANSTASTGSFTGGKIVAGALQPALFLHFAHPFP